MVLEFIPVPKLKLLLDCNLRLGVSSLNSESTLGDRWTSISCTSELGLGDRGGGGKYWDRGLGEGEDGTCEGVERTGAGDRGAINPSDVPLRDDVCLILETLSKETNEKMDRIRDTRAVAACIEDATEGELGSAVVQAKVFRIGKGLEYEGTYQ